MTNGNDFDADLAELGRIRFTLEDMKRYGLHGGLPQEQAFFLLGFIDKLWKEYVHLQAESEAWDKLSLVQLSQQNEQLKQQLADTKADYLRRHNDAVDRYEEIERLRDALRRVRRIAAEGTTHTGMIAALGILVDRAQNPGNGPLPPDFRYSSEVVDSETGIPEYVQCWLDRWGERLIPKADVAELALIILRRATHEPEASHYCIDCNEAHDPRTCGALKSGDGRIADCTNCPHPDACEADGGCEKHV